MIRQALSILSFAFVTACGATSGQSDLASTSRPTYYKVDLTKSKTWNTDVNLMDDSISGPFDGVAVQLPVKKDQLTVTIKPGEESKCKILSIDNNSVGAVIKLTAQVDTDNADSFCELKVSAKDGRKGTINFYEVGT